MTRRDVPLPNCRCAALAMSTACFVVCGGGGGGASGSDGGGASDPGSIASWRSRDAKPLMSIVTVAATGPAWPYDTRRWQSSTRAVGVLPMWAAVRLDTNGRDDFALPMYTETPTTATPPMPMPMPRSVAFVSRPDGRYQRLGLGVDANGPHMDAARVAGAWQLFVPNGGPSFESGSFEWGGTFTWRWNGAGFSKLGIGGARDPQAQAFASAALVRPFGDSGELWLVRFADQTDVLRPEFRIDGEIDDSPRFIDVDGSGIDTIFMGEGRYKRDRSRHGNYILVNDGTGRLHAAMDAEFTALGRQVRDHVNAQSGLFADERANASFMAYRRPDGKINFLAQMLALRRGTVDPGSQLFVFVNVPLGIDITTGFKRDLTVPTRNGSRNIRTLARNDTIHRALGDPDCRIDGGLGTNTAVDPGQRADWLLARDGSVVTVSPAGGGSIDRLKRIQRARFDDTTLDLTTL